MPKVSNDEVKRIADLIRLDLTDREAASFETYINGVLNYAKGMEDVDTEGLEPTYTVVEVENVFRKDEPKHTITQEEALQNAPDQADGQFRVPSILE